VAFTGTYAVFEIVEARHTPDPEPEDIVSEDNHKDFAVNNNNNNNNNNNPIPASIPFEPTAAAACSASPGAGGPQAQARGGTGSCGSRLTIMS